jgi:hypothetical protein
MSDYTWETVDDAELARTPRMFDLIVSSDVALRLAYLEGVSTAEMQRQREIVLARKYHEGVQGAQLTPRLQEFLSEGSDPFRLNVCANVVTAVSERLSVEGFDCTNVEVLKWIQKLWNDDNVDAKQEEVHECALRDGEYFIIVDWDAENNRPTFIPHDRYTSIEADGDGQGCILLYEEDDPNQKPQAGLKQWTEQAGDKITERRNIYYPDRIEKYARRNKADWQLIETVDWTDPDGKPLGIAIIHFKNKALRPEASDAMPLQRAVNKSLLDLLTASDLTAFRIFTAFGFIPTVDGGPLKEDRSNLLPIEPGQVVGTTKAPGDASFTAINGSDLMPLMDLTHQLILWLAIATNTPVSRFTSTKLIASDETLKEQEGPLMSRVHSRQISFGNSWTQCLKLAAALQNAFGTAEPTIDGFGAVLDTETVLQPIWAEAQSRSQQERMDLLLKKKALGVPQEQLWREAGYSTERIELMKAEQAAQQQQAIKNAQDMAATQPDAQQIDPNSKQKPGDQLQPPAQRDKRLGGRPALKSNPNASGGNK